MVKLYGLFLAMWIACGLFVACSSDDDKDENEENVVDKKDKTEGKRLKSIEIVDSYGLVTADFFYNSQNQLANIRFVDETDRETWRVNINFVWNGNTIGWDTGEEKYYATVANGRTQNMTMVYDGYSSDMGTFYYDEKGRLERIGDQYSHEVAWDGDNISRYEVKYNGEIRHRIDYTYTKHSAGMIAYEFCFNPFAEFDFLDVLPERALFYTGYCGPMSKNLPSKAIYRNGKGEETGSHTYKYKFQDGLVKHVDIDGYGDVGMPYPISMNFTWEE